MFRGSTLRTMVMTGLLVALVTVIATGQPAPPANPDAAPRANAAEAAETASTGPAEEHDTLFKMILASGTSGVAFMVVLGLFSVVAAAIALERLVNVTHGKIVPGNFTQDLRELTRRKEIRPEPYRELADRSPAPIAKVLRSAVLRAGRPLPEVEKVMEDSVSKEVAVLRNTIRPLSVIGNVAPLVGLLGTVVGMIDAFRVASQAGLGKAEVLAQGIYLALLTTAAGLIIAIPCVLLAAYLTSRIDKYMWEADTILMDTMPAFSAMETARV